MEFDEDFEPDFTIYDIITKEHLKMFEFCTKHGQLIELFNRFAMEITDNLNKLFILNNLRSSSDELLGFHNAIEFANAHNIIDDYVTKHLMEFKNIRNDITHENNPPPTVMLIYEKTLEINQFYLISKIRSLEKDHEI
jgi:hypothetical protein